MNNESMHRCYICGDFHLSTIPECDTCLRAATTLRALVERGGGTLNIIDGTIKVRTKAQMACPIEALHYLSEVRDIAARLRGEA
jgi:hypothetical protein